MICNLSERNNEKSPTIFPTIHTSYKSRAAPEQNRNETKKNNPEKKNERNNINRTPPRNQINIHSCNRKQIYAKKN